MLRHIVTDEPDGQTEQKGKQVQSRSNTTDVSSQSLMTPTHIAAITAQKRKAFHVRTFQRREQTIHTLKCYCLKGKKVIIWRRLQLAISARDGPNESRARELFSLSISLLFYYPMPCRDARGLFYYDDFFFVWCFTRFTTLNAALIILYTVHGFSHKRKQLIP